MNKDACDAQGGTWCPSKADCSLLQECVNEMATEADAEGRLAFEQYLLGAPNITDPTNRHQCGKVRGYFGFDEFFVNDVQICEDIEQLKFARDFDFLNEFFAKGSGGEEGSDSGGSTPELALIPPDRSKLCVLFVYTKLVTFSSRRLFNALVSN